MSMAPAAGPAEEQHAGQESTEPGRKGTLLYRLRKLSFLMRGEGLTPSCTAFRANRSHVLSTGAIYHDFGFSRGFFGRVVRENRS